MAGYGEDSYDDQNGVDSYGGGGGGGGYGGRGRGRGRGRGSGRGRDYGSNNGGSSYGGGSNDNNDDGWGDSGGGSSYNDRNGGDGGGYGGHDDDSRGGSSYGGGRGGRGGRGGGRGRGRGGGGFGGGGRRNEDDDESSDWQGGDSKEFRKGGGGDGGDGEPEKPKERYEPPEPSNDENVIFGSGISSGINFDKYDNISVKVTGENVVPPVSSFEECELRSFLVDNVARSGYKKPTPVQKNAIPIIKKGRDLMACAQTGSGKTAAFLLPIIHKLVESPVDLITGSCVEPQAVILAPTRELAIQIHDEARKFSHSSIIKVAIAYGGTTVYSQANRISQGCHILVATPGRLNDFVERGRIKFSSVRFFVLDEADRMLDMGFLPAVEKMLNHESMVPMESRQTLMFSATFPPAIQNLAQNYLNNYLFLAVGVVGGACTDVEQTFVEVSKFDKKGKLIEALKDNPDLLTLVFVEQKRIADFIAAYLSENDFPTTSIHGDRLQSQREEALRDFKTSRRPTLVATAVAARGLDIKNVGHVINFDLPQSIDEYVHRIGRTGRVGNRGKATSFFDPNQDSSIAGDLVAILEQAGQTVPPFLTSYSGGGGGGGGFDSYGGRDVRRGNFGGGRGGGGGGGGGYQGGGGGGGGDGDWGSSEPANSAPAPAAEEDEEW